MLRSWNWTHRPLQRCFALGVVSVALWLAACGGGESETPAQTPTPTTAPEPATPPQPAPVPTPPPTTGSSNDPYPVPDLDLAAGDAEAGNVHYQQYCVTCHGASGKGDGPLAAALNPKPADHSDGTYMNALSDANLSRVIKYGGPSVDRSPLMAPWGGTLSDEQIVDVIAFVRSLADPPYPR